MKSSLNTKHHFDIPVKVVLFVLLLYNSAFAQQSLLIPIGKSKVLNLQNGEPEIINKTKFEGLYYYSTYLDTVQNNFFVRNEDQQEMFLSRNDSLISGRSYADHPYQKNLWYNNKNLNEPLCLTNYINDYNIGLYSKIKTYSHSSNDSFRLNVDFIKHEIGARSANIRTIYYIDNSFDLVFTSSDGYNCSFLYSLRFDSNGELIKKRKIAIDSLFSFSNTNIAQAVGCDAISNGGGGTPEESDGNDGEGGKGREPDEELPGGKRNGSDYTSDFNTENIMFVNGVNPEPPLDINDELIEFRVFPNPANHQLSIDLGLLKGKELQQLRVFSVEGKEVNTFNYTVANGVVELEDLQNLEKGTYLVQLTIENKVYAISFVKE